MTGTLIRRDGVVIGMDTKAAVEEGITGGMAVVEVVTSTRIDRGVRRRLALCLSVREYDRPRGGTNDLLGSKACRLCRPR
jgi:hypothetical protein